MSDRPWTLVTGGAKGLGAEICRTLARNGHNVLIHYQNSQIEADALVSECKKQGIDAASIQGDFASMEAVDDFIAHLISHFLPVTNIVNNVGSYIVQSLLVTEVKEWQQLFQTNLFAPLTLINALLPAIKRHKGSIINLGVVGINHIPADTYATAYTASKLALWMATKSYAKALANEGVRANMISPGILDNAVDKPKDHSKLPMGRPGTLQEVARVVAFLLENENSHITGQNIEVAGALRL